MIQEGTVRNIIYFLFFLKLKKLELNSLNFSLNHLSTRRKKVLVCLRSSYITYGDYNANDLLMFACLM